MEMGICVQSVDLSVETLDRLHLSIFLRVDGVSFLAERFKIPLKSVERCLSEQFAHPLGLRAISNSSLLGKGKGDRDHFDPSKSHRHCDGHTNTLNVILDTDGNVFGCFTPLEWRMTVCNVSFRDDPIEVTTIEMFEILYRWPF
jgi:hypothetical protein